MERVKDERGNAVQALVHLSSAEMSRLPRPRAGFEVFTPQLVALVEDKPEALHIAGFDAQATLDELRAYQEMQSVVAQAQQQLALAVQTRLLHAANVWRITLRIYRHALLAAADDPDIRYRIAAFEAFMKNGPRKKAAAVTEP